MTYLRFMVFAILFMCVESKSTFAFQESVEGQDVNSPREIQAEGIIITWSEKNDELRGFSQKLGEWEVLKIDPQKLNPQQKITPVVDSNIAAVRFGDSIAAFSGEKGWWDVIELSEDSRAVPVVSPSLAVFEDDGHLYTFSANKGSWSSPTDPNLVPVEQEIKLSGPSPDAKGRQRLNEWMQQLPRYMERGISVKTMTGRIIVMVSRRNWLPVVLQKVDETLVTAPNSASDRPQNATPDARSEEIQTQMIARLRDELATMELAVQAGSGQLGNPNIDQDQQSRELRKLVEQSFDLRQQLQELEAQRLRLKLQQVENNLAVRAKSREAIVERRMVELRRPDSGNKVQPEEPDNRSTSRDNSVGSDSTDLRVSDVRIENAASKIQWPQPVEIARQLRSFRNSADQIADGIRDPKFSVKTWSQPLQKLIADGHLLPGTGEETRQEGIAEAENRATQLQKQLNEVRQDWNHAWSSYQAQLQLLKLDVEQAKSKAESMAAQHARVSQLHAAGNIAQEKLDEINAAFTASKAGHQRAEQMLRLYADIEAIEPELNPATLKGLDDIAASTEATASVPIDPNQNLPQQVISMAEQLRKFRDTAVKLREERQPHENLITQYSRPLDQLKAEGVVSAETTEVDLKTQIARSKPEFDRLTRELDTATKAWKQVWSAYQSQSRLFDLEVREAREARAAAEETFVRNETLVRQGFIDPPEARNAEVNLKAAALQVEKATERFRMWKELEENEPDFNPDWKPNDAPTPSAAEH